MTILYTCGNTNLKTVRLVAIAVKSLTGQDKSKLISKVVIFSSSETSEEPYYTEQAKIYEEVLGKHIRIEKVPLSGCGLGKVEDLTAVFNDDSSKYVDLTNGQKAATAQLYLTASLLQINNIYYISLLCDPEAIPTNSEPIWGKHYEYIRLPPFTNISSLSRLSYFDLIFYLEEIEKIFVDVPKNSFLYKISRDLRKSILTFFQGDSFRSAVSDATTSSEVLINELIVYLKDDQNKPAKELANKFKINFKQKDPLGAISYFFRIYSEKSSKETNYFDENLEALVTVPGMLTPLRIFRNLSAHAGISSHEFEANEVRICINLALECFRCAKASPQFWKRIQQR